MQCCSKVTGLRLALFLLKGNISKCSRIAPNQAFLFGYSQEDERRLKGKYVFVHDSTGFNFWPRHVLKTKVLSAGHEPHVQKDML